MADEVKIEGMEQLLDALANCSLNLVEKRKLIVKALRAGSKPIEDEGKLRFGTQYQMRTGLAKASISTSVLNQRSDSADAQIGPKRFYPKFGEYGTVYQTSKPFLGPAFDAKVEEAVDIIGDVLGEGIEDSYSE